MTALAEVGPGTAAEAFFADVVRAYRAEIADLEAAGCRYIQIDDPLFSYFISERMRAEVIANGERPEDRLLRYVRLINDCIAERRAGTAIGIHVCRGNARSAWIAEGGYERIAEALFGGLHNDHFLLEYDDDRSGDFEPLRFMPKDKRVVTTFIFQVRNIPAALYKALGGFATNGINMTKLESYMVGGSFAATQFYADVEGHPEHRGLQLALEELDFVCQPKSLRILGVYPAHKFRRKLKAEKV